MNDLSAHQQLMLSPEGRITTTHDLGFGNAQLIGVDWPRLSAAGIRVSRLKELGWTAAQLKKSGVDALTLAMNVQLTNEIMALFGATETIKTFITTPSDAVAIASSEAAATLELSTEALLQRCPGAPIEARAVLEQLPTTDIFTGVKTRTLLDTGLRGKTLQAMGITLLEARMLEGTSQEQLSLGYSL
jgi:hypothetical protein